MTYRAATRALLRETVVGAMRELVEARPWTEITVAEVARAAGVSRQTLYNEFGGRDGLALTYAQWAATAFLDEIEREVEARVEDLDDALVGVFELFLQIARNHPLLRAVEATSGVQGVAAFVSDQNGRIVIESATERLTDIITRTWSALDHDAVGAVSEAIVRLAISHLTVPNARPAEAAARVHAVLMPAVREILAAPPASEAG